MVKKRSTSKKTGYIPGNALDSILAVLFLQKKEQRSQIISISGTNAKVGTTMLSVAVASAVADAGWNTLLIGTGINKKSGNKDTQPLGLADFLTGKCEEKSIYYQTGIQGLTEVPYGRTYVSPVKLFGAKNYEVWHESLREKYDVVIYDLPPVSLEPAVGIVASKTDGVILVAEQHRSTKARLLNAYKALESCGADCWGVVLNKVNKSECRRFVKNPYVIGSQSQPENEHIGTTDL